MLLRTPEGKKLVVNLQVDECLYDAPHNPTNTGTRYTSGTDLYAHKSRSGNIYFYSYDWSMWQGTEDSYTLLTEDETKDFLLNKASISGHVADGINDSVVEKYFPDLFDEDA